MAIGGINDETDSGIFFYLPFGGGLAFWRDVCKRWVFLCPRGLRYGALLRERSAEHCVFDGDTVLGCHLHLGGGLLRPLQETKRGFALKPFSLFFVTIRDDIAGRHEDREENSANGIDKPGVLPFFAKKTDREKKRGQDPPIGEAHDLLEGAPFLFLRSVVSLLQ